MSAVSKVLIVGGGIAGLSAAVGLQRHGIQCDVVEIAAERRLGAGINLQPSACAAIERLGLLDEVAGNGRRGTSWFTAYNATGRELARVPMPTAPEWPQVRIGIGRWILIRTLQDVATQAGAAFAIGLSVASLEQTADAVRVAFTDGRTDTYDLVIGADGHRSSVRRMVFGEEHMPRHVGQSGIRFVTAPPEDFPEGGAMLADPPPLFLAWRFPGDDGADLLYTAMNLNIAGDVRVPAERVPELVAEKLAVILRIAGPGNAPSWVTELHGTFSQQPAGLLYDAYQSFLMPDPWFRGRVVLIGDAAHTAPPHIGAVGTIAIEDAAILSELMAEDGDVADLLGQFMTRRFERAKMVVENATLLSEWEQTFPTLKANDPVGYADLVAKYNAVSRRSLHGLAEPL